MYQIECTSPPDKAVTSAVVAPVAAGRGECSLEPRNAATWREIAVFLAVQTLPRRPRLLTA